MILVHVFVYLPCITLANVDILLAVACDCGSPWTFHLTYFLEDTMTTITVDIAS